LIVDLSNFNTVVLTDRERYDVAIGGGVRLGNLDLALHDIGNRAISHGTCPGVGVGGHFTHGGYGSSSRNWGLALDSIVGMDVVTANGSIKYVTKNQTPELFWVMLYASLRFSSPLLTIVLGNAWCSRLLWHRHYILRPNQSRSINSSLLRMVSFGNVRRQKPLHQILSPPAGLCQELHGRRSKHHIRYSPGWKTVPSR